MTGERYLFSPPINICVTSVVHFDLAELYDIETKQLKRSVKRNRAFCWRKFYVAKVTREQLLRS